ncbi:MAG: hypothetical protein QNI84_14555 [Henriciella sp.]|nr:hypothetical protein [Henriciella sp.]
MRKRSVRWGADIGYQDKIKTLEVKTNLAAHGLKGKLAQGELGISKTVTRSQAKKDATDGIPVSEAITQDQWSEREQEIAEKAERVRRGLTTWMSSATKAVRNFITDCTPADIHPDHLREVIKAEENEFRHYEIDDATSAAEHHDATVIELQEFRSTHGDQIGKRTPDIKKNVEQTIAILIFIMIIEGCFNALLFKDAQSSGLLGGMMIAFGVSAVNVLFGVVGGFLGLRYLNHPAMPMKVIGGVVAGICVLLGIFLNLFVAHFRDAVEAGLIAAKASGSLAGFSMFDITPGMVIGDMFPNVFGLDSLVAIGLLLIGITIFAIALYEGYDKLSDRYPGYGRVWRKERLAYEQRQAVRNGVRDDLSDYFTRCRFWFETQHSRHTAAKREIEKAMNELDERRDLAVSIAARAGDQERSLKVAYRQAHRRQRNAMRDKLGEQAAVPAYFDEIVTPNLPPFDHSKERAQADEALRTIDNNLTAINITREWLEQHIQQVQKGLSSIEKKARDEMARVREDRMTAQTGEARRA